MNVTKIELCNRVAKRFESGQPPGIIDYKLIVEAFLDEIMVVMSEGSRIEIRGFGCFKPRMKKKRVGRNPRSKDIYVVPEYLAPYFKFSEEAQKIFNEKTKPTKVEKP